jgi:hypothetical protein
MSSISGIRKACAGFAAATSLLLAQAAAADPVTLTVDPTISFQQRLNRPCVIGDPSCHNPASLPYTLLDSHMGSATVSSPTYTVEQIRNIVGGNTFFVGLDVNQAMGHNGGAYNLLSFTMSVDGTTVFSTTGATTVTPTNPGNGYSDAAIGGFDLTAFAASSTLVFTTRFSGDTAGREQYFLRAAENGAPIPEPATILLVASGLAGALARRRRRTSASA